MEHQRFAGLTGHAHHLADQQQVVAHRATVVVGATRVASAPSMAATPSGVSRTVTSANLSGTAGSAKRRANASCPLARMLIAKCALSRNTARLGERFTRLHSTSGGSSDSEAKELMVSPTLRPSAARVVTMATPVG